MSELVYVRRQPNDWRTASYRVDDVDGIRFSAITGGTQTLLSHDALCGYVYCDAMVEDELAHSCEHGEGPHRIKVVIPKSHNDPRLWAKLAGQEYREPKPLDMSPEAIQTRRNRSLKSAQTRAAKRAALAESLAESINDKWPTGPMPSAETISGQLEIPKSIARDARRKAIESRLSAR